MPPQRQKRRRKQPATPALLRFWWIGLILVALLVGSASFLLRPRTTARRLPGYVPSGAELLAEYSRQYGSTAGPDVSRQWEQSNALVASRDYAGAAVVLEDLSKVARVPAVFNNLGVLYAELNDRGRCIHAFREVLALDSAYRPTRENLDRLKGFVADLTAPVTREVEPNDTNSSANVVTFDSPIEGAIAGESGDVDSYVINVPPAPRDLLDIEISSRSKELIPSFRIYDTNLQLTNLGRSAVGPGSPLSLRLTPDPGSTIYLQVLGVRQTSGDYSLRITPAHAFDTSEPNDDIFTARHIELDQPADANIMDAKDTDFYSFLSPRDGQVTIDVQNRSTTLIPALTTFTPDKRNSGFGPQVRTRGGSLHHVLTVQEHQTYFLQVWGQSDTAGDYRLTVK